MFDKKEYMKEYRKQWCKDNPEYHKEYHRKWQQNNREKLRKIQKKYYENNKDKCLNNSAEWALNNYERVKKLARDWRRNEWRKNLKFNLNIRMSRGINLSIKDGKNGRHWESIIDYKLVDLIKHLEKTIPKGYTWQDYLNGKLHIDHIIPVSAFNFDFPKNPDFKKCWNLNNLRLLPAKDNLIKHTKLDKPFQPALKI